MALPSGRMSQVTLSPGKATRSTAGAPDTGTATSTCPFPTPGRRSTTMVDPDGRHDEVRTRAKRDTSVLAPMAVSAGEGVGLCESAMLDVGAGGLDSCRAGGAGAFVQLAATSRAPTSMNRVAMTPLTPGRSGEPTARRLPAGCASFDNLCRVFIRLAATSRAVITSACLPPSSAQFRSQALRHPSPGRQRYGAIRFTTSAATAIRNAMAASRLLIAPTAIALVTSPTRHTSIPPKYSVLTTGQYQSHSGWR